MEHLSEQDWLFLSQLIYRLNTIQDIKEFQTVCLKQLKILIPCVKALFYRSSRKNGKIIYEYPVVINREGQSFDEEKYMNGNFGDFKSFHYSLWSTVVRNSDLEPENEFLDSRLYKEIYLPQNLYYSLKLVLIYSDTLLGSVVLFRSKEEQDFSEREIFIMDVLKKHLALKLSQLTAIPGMAEYPVLLNTRRYSLTNRETEVMQLLREGKQNQEICKRLFISESTLCKHIHHIYQKLGIKNRTQLLQFISERNHLGPIGPI